MREVRELLGGACREAGTLLLPRRFRSEPGAGPLPRGQLGMRPNEGELLLRGGLLEGCAQGTVQREA